MAYQAHTSIAGHKALMGLLETFLSAQGWTINDNTVGAERALYVSKANGGETFYFEMDSLSTDNIDLKAGVAHPVTGDVSDTVYMNLTTGTMPRAWFFVGDLYCHVVVEVATGYFQNFGFGRLTPAYTYSVSDHEGAFVYGSDTTEWSSIIGTPYHDRLSLMYYNDTTHPLTFRSVLTSGVAWEQPYRAINYLGGTSSLSPFGYIANNENSTGDRIMLPIRIPIENDPSTADNDLFMFGTIPSMAAFSALDLVNATTETIDSDDWVKFPQPYHNQGVTPVILPLGWAFMK